MVAIQPQGTPMDKARSQRIKSALWGLFVADSLAMPAHWYYDLEKLKKDFSGGITDFQAPPHPHPDSFMVGMDYFPDVQSAQQLQREYDIVHEHKRFYNTSFSTTPIESTHKETQHGNPVPELSERFHYHHGLNRGDNTLGAHLVRVLMRSVIEHKNYTPEEFLDAFVDHMTTQGFNKDPYTEIYIRRWFENYALGISPYDCAANQRDIWSIGSHGGMIRPLVVAMSARNPYEALGIALQHQQLTHKSQNIASALAVLVPLLYELLEDKEPLVAWMRYADRLYLPKTKGKELFTLYRQHKGPGNIPKEQMWQLHTQLEKTAFDLRSFAKKHPKERVVKEILSNACYPEHGVPLLFYIAYINGMEFRQSILDNVNAGGDNVHRGMVLGLLLGAAMPVDEKLKEGLTDYEELSKEIDAFASVIA